jgi:hypothetical protein
MATNASTPPVAGKKTIKSIMGARSSVPLEGRSLTLLQEEPGALAEWDKRAAVPVAEEARSK